MAETNNRPTAPMRRGPMGRGMGGGEKAKDTKGANYKAHLVL